MCIQSCRERAPTVLDAQSEGAKYLQRTCLQGEASNLDTWYQAARMVEATGRYQSKACARQGVSVGESRCPTALQSSELDREWQRGTGHLYLAVGMGSHPCLEA